MWLVEKWIPKNFEKPLILIAAAFALTAILLSFEFNLLEANLYDFRMIRGPQKAPDASIVLVTLDDLTAKALDEFAPLPLDLHTRFLESLEHYSPKAVGYLVDLNQVNQVNPELFKKEWGTRFVEVAKRMTAKGSVVLLGTPYDVTGEVLPPFPLSTIPHSIAVIHKDGNVFSEDKITRRALVDLNEKPVFHLELANRLGLIASGFSPRGSFAIPEIDSRYFFFRYHGNTIFKPKFPDSLNYKTYSFVDIMHGTLPKNALEGKIVLVGTLSKDDSADFAFTPYSKTAFVNPKLAIHANILDSVIHNDGIVRSPNWFNGVITFVLSLIVLTSVLNSTPLSGVFSTLGLAIAFVVLGQISFYEGFWIRESQPLVAIFVSYYLVVPYRLIREYKQRWDYQKKNEVLTQVEELKTNFLSLVTHDLKTPVARIQGLAEVILRKSSERLLDRDKESLTHIMDSTEELNRFISSILELSKAESQNLKLHLESKDLNQLIERSIEGSRAQARARNIKITSNLEPLFPVKVDVSLLSKVINNLIDNAIKYSPMGSAIHLESKEVDSWVQVSVKDQGIGMNEEERRNLFTKFYRVNNSTISKTPGTGLGLYLTKFFIEAHQGRVEVESETGQGTTFKIILPLQGAEPIADASRSPGLTRILPWLTRKGSLRSNPSKTANEKEKAHV